MPKKKRERVWEHCSLHRWERTSKIQRIFSIEEDTDPDLRFSFSRVQLTLLNVSFQNNEKTPQKKNVGFDPLFYHVLPKNSVAWNNLRDYTPQFASTILSLRPLLLHNSPKGPNVTWTSGGLIGGYGNPETHNHNPQKL